MEVEEGFRPRVVCSDFVSDLHVLIPVPTGTPFPHCQHVDHTAPAYRPCSLMHEWTSWSRANRKLPLTPRQFQYAYFNFGVYRMLLENLGFLVSVLFWSRAPDTHEDVGWIWV